MKKKKIVDWSIVINYDEDNSWGVVDSTNNPVEIIHQNQLDDHILSSVDSYLHEIKRLRREVWKKKELQKQLVLR